MPARSSEPNTLRIIPLTGIPEVEPGADLAALLRAAAERASVSLADGVLVVCQKIVSKAEGRMVDLASIEPSEEAQRIAREDERDPRHVELVLSESARIVRRGHGVLICETHHGLVCANAGVDLSNSPGPEIAILLPKDCDASAAALRDALCQGEECRLGVVISDTFGRPWREGLVDYAIGSAGLAPIADLRGRPDLSGRELQVTATATVDQLAAAAGILMVKDAAIPAVWIEGLLPEGEGGVREMLRDPATDLFR
ncbi:MAG: coenzyme F420-0:L-glutamate ligase [Deltaproteobacteria bacterium]|nr:coenzyme F420-0:L-glutamate ligase [Deltaproteobacteria bacterium]